MRKIISFILGSIFALNFLVSSAFSAANEVRIAFFLRMGNSKPRRYELKRLLIKLLVFQLNGLTLQLVVK